MVEWLRPWVLLGLPILVAWWFWKVPGSQAPLPQFLPDSRSPASETRGAHSWEPWFSTVQLLRLATLIILLLALAGPVARRPRPSTPKEGLALMLALDLSGSMGLSEAGQESRLDMARREMSRFIRARTQDRIGLVTFGEEALTRVPPTTAHPHLLEVLEDLEVKGPDEGTALGLGLGLAAHATLKVPTPSRVVLLLTDGRSNAGSVEPASAAAAAAALGVRIHTVGVGGGEGEDPMDEALLRRLAEMGRGRFFRAADAGGLRGVLEALNSLETGPVVDGAGFIFEARHRALLAMALALLSLESLLRILPRGRVS